MVRPGSSEIRDEKEGEEREEGDNQKPKRPKGSIKTETVPSCTVSTGTKETS